MLTKRQRQTLGAARRQVSGFSDDIGDVLFPPRRPNASASTSTPAHPWDRRRHRAALPLPGAGPGPYGQAHAASLREALRQATEE